MLKQDPEIFIRKRMEHAMDEGDMATAIEMSRMIDEMMLRLNRSEAAEQSRRQQA